MGPRRRGEGEVTTRRCWYRASRARMVDEKLDRPEDTVDLDSIPLWNLVLSCVC